MDSDLLLIFGFVLSLCLIIFPFAHITHRKVIKHDERKLELQARIAEAEAGTSTASDKDYVRLEERVRVLERIATDKGSDDLTRQIEALRDVQEIEQLTTPKEIAQ